MFEQGKFAKFPNRSAFYAPLGDVLWVTFSRTRKSKYNLLVLFAGSKRTAKKYGPLYNQRAATYHFHDYLRILFTKSIPKRTAV